MVDVVDLSSVKVGDKLVRVCDGRLREVVTVRSVVGRLIDVGKHRASFHYRFDGTPFKGTSFGSLRRSSPGELEEIEQERLEKQRLADEAHQARINSESYKLANRVSNTDVEMWEKMPLERLRQVVAWMDDVYAAK